MIDFLKPFAGYIIVTVVAFLTGSLVALNAASDQTCYFEFKWGKDSGFSLRKNKITEYDLHEITKQDASALRVKIGELKYENPLSVELRNLRDCSRGPFQYKNVDVDIIFSDEEMIKDDWALACSGEIVNRVISISEVIEPANLTETILGMQEFKVWRERPSPVCNQAPINVGVIWISAEKACEWLGKDREDLPKNCKVRASILRKVHCTE